MRHSRGWLRGDVHVRVVHVHFGTESAPASLLLALSLIQRKYQGQLARVWNKGSWRRKRVDDVAAYLLSFPLCSLLWRDPIVRNSFHTSRQAGEWTVPLVLPVLLSIENGFKSEMTNDALNRNDEREEWTTNLFARQLFGLREPCSCQHGET